MLTAQQIFDKVAAHLLTQGKASFASTGVCAYRGTDGTSCAVGCLIPDSHYRPEFESPVSLKRAVRGDPSLYSTDPGTSEFDASTSVRWLSHYKPFAEALGAGGVDVREHIPLLTDLQHVHDGNRECPSNFASGLERIALRHKLNPTVLTNYANSTTNL